MGLSGGGGTGGGAIRAGQAFVELVAKDNALLRALDRAKARMQAFGATVARAGAATAAAGAGLLAPVAGLFDAAVKRGSALANLADEFGTTAESLSSLAYAFGTAGIAQEEFIDTVKGLSQKLAEGADGSDELFTRLGLSAKELIALPVDQQFAKIADALAAVGNAADRTNVGLQLFGGAGSKLTRVLAQGSGELSRLRGEAEDVGAVMSGETAQSAQRLERSLSRAWTAAANAILAVGEALFPTAEGFDGIIRAVTAAAAAARAFIQENKALVVGVAAVGGALVAAGGAAVVLGTAVAGLGALIGVATGAVSLLGSVVTALISPLGLAAAAVGGLGYAFLRHTAAGKALADTVGGRLADAWGTVRDAALDAGRGIMSALSRGDLAAAGEIALAGLQVAWQQALLTARTALADLADYARTKWAALTDPLTEPFVAVAGAVRESWQALTEFGAQVARVASDAGAALLDFLRPALDAVRDAWQSLTTFAAESWEAVSGAVKAAAGALAVVFAPAVTAAAVAWAALSKLFEGGFSGLVMNLRDVWTDFTGFMIRQWSRAVASVLSAGSSLAGALGAGKLGEDLEALARETARAGELEERRGEVIKRRRREEFEAEVKARKAAAAAERDAAKDAAAAGLDANVAALDAAKKRLADLLGGEDRGPARGPLAALDKRVAELADTVAKSVRGATGVTDFRAVFAVGDSVASRSLRVQEQVRDNVKRVEAAIKGAPGPVFG